MKIVPWIVAGILVVILMIGVIVNEAVDISLPLVALVAGLWSSEQPKWIVLLQSLQIEKQRIMRSLSSVELEMKNMKTAYAELERQHGAMQNDLTDSKTAYEQRVLQLELEKRQLLEDRELWETRNQELSGSADSLMSLETILETTLQEAETAIEAQKTWTIIAIAGTIGALIIGFIIGALAF